jgi:hypothetical protein
MFSWFRKSDRPPTPATENPGRGHDVRVAFRNAQKAWEETDDVVDSLTAALKAHGHDASAKGDWVALDGGFSLLPQIVNVEAQDNDGVKSVTTIQISHAALIPGGTFEFQHSSGADLRDSLAKGFDSWAELDLPVFLDALRDQAATCMTVQLEPDRRVVFGPTIQMAENPEAVPGHDDFCPCCLFTKSTGAFDVLVRDKAFFGIRLFVSRSEDGHIEADCRVNGIDRPEGAAALTRYAKTWPDRGFEYRKQYVCIQTRTGEVVSARQVGQHVTVPGGRTP